MIEGLHFVRSAATKSRPVRWYVYAWRGGPRVMTADGPKKPKLSAEALAAFTAATEDARQVKPDSMAGLIRKWRGSPADLDTASPEWRKLATTTRRTWGLALDLIEDKWGKLPIRFGTIPAWSPMS